MLAADVMTRDVVTIRLDTPVSQIAKMLVEQKISAVPVVDNEGRIVGMVSESDLLHRKELGTERYSGRWLEFFTSDGQFADEYVKAHGRTAEEVMRSPAITAAPETPLTEIVALMEKHGIKRVPIVDESGALAGLVTRGNLVRALALTPADEPTTGLDDLKIRDLLLAELVRQPWGRHRDADVTVMDGVVHLWGVVDTEGMSRALVTAAKGTPGAQSVRDHTRVPEYYPHALA
jgi:CBS domain-containing protein